MNVVNLSAFKASKVNSSEGTRYPVRSVKGAPGRQSLHFEGGHEEVIDAVVKWLTDSDQYGPVELVVDSETVMLIRKGSVEFIEAYRDSGRPEWYAQIPRGRAIWWMLEEDAGICQVRVLTAIVKEHRDALAELLRDGIGKDSWRENAFVVAMDDDKDRYYEGSFG